MSAEIVNLRRFRKRPTRDEREREAERNRRLHGRTGADKKREAAERQRSERHIDGHRLQPDED